MKLKKFNKKILVINNKYISMKRNIIKRCLKQHLMYLKKNISNLRI